jgi:RND family efflux transporter MFP subunit
VSAQCFAFCQPVRDRSERQAPVSSRGDRANLGDVTHEEKLRADLASLRLNRDAATPGTKTRPRRTARRRWPYVLAAFVLLAAATAWVAFGRPKEVTVAYATATTTAEAGPMPVLSGSGYVVTGERYVSIGVRVPGRIDKYFVEEGQTVKKGDPLVQLDDRDYRAVVQRTEAGIAMARANLELAQSEQRRGRALFKEGVISQQELDVLDNKVAVAEASAAQLDAELAQARVNLEYTTLRAPTDGVVLAKLKEVGEIAVPGGFAGSGDLIRIANLTDIRAEVDVNEADLNRVRMGQPAMVTPDAYPDAEYRAEVVKLYPQVDRQKGTLKVEVRVLNADERLLPDMSARITFLAEEAKGAEDEAQAAEQKRVVLVAPAAVKRSAQGDSFVWVVTDGRVRRVPVETAGQVGDKVRVSGGLAGGETLVTSDVELDENDRVEPLGNVH